MDPIQGAGLRLQTCVGRTLNGRETGSHPSFSGRGCLLKGYYCMSCYTASAKLHEHVCILFNDGAPLCSALVATADKPKPVHQSHRLAAQKRFGSLLVSRSKRHCCSYPVQQADINQGDDGRTHFLDRSRNARTTGGS